MKKKISEGQKLLPNQVALLKQVSESFKVLSESVKNNTEEHMFLKKEIEDKTNGKVVVKHTIYPGVQINISNRVYSVKDMKSRCQFRVAGADVISTAI